MNAQNITNAALTLVEVGSATIKRAIDEVSVHRQAQKRAADLRGPLLDHLLKAGVVSESQKQAAEAMLGSHAETLQLLKVAVDKMVAANAANSEKQASDLGRPVTDRQAGMGSAQQIGEYDSMKDPFVGRRTGEKKASDLALMRAMD